MQKINLLKNSGELVSKLMMPFLVCLAIMIYVPALFHNNLWVDEIYTVLYLNGSVNDVFGTIIYNDVHPPLYYVILKIWTYLFSDNLVSLRFFSLIPILLFAVLGGGPFKKLFGNKTAFLWTLCMMFSPFAFYMALDIRMYSWCTFFVSGALLYSFMVMKDNNYTNWIMLTLFSVCGVLTHYYCAFAIGLVWLFLTLHFFMNFQKCKKMLKSYFLCGSFVFLIALCCLMILYGQYTHQIDNSWISMETVKEAIVKNIFFAPKNTFFSLLTWGLFFVSLFKTLVHNKNSVLGFVRTAGLMVLILFVVGIGISFLLKPLFVYRYFYPFLGCFFLVVSYGIFKTKYLYILYIILFVWVFVGSYHELNARISDLSRKDIINALERIDKNNNPIIFLDGSKALLFYQVYSNKLEYKIFQTKEDFLEMLDLNLKRDVYLFSPSGEDMSDSGYFENVQCYFFKYDTTNYCIAKLKK